MVTVALRNSYIYKDFVWDILDRVIHKALYRNPLDFSKDSKIYDNVMIDEIKLTYTSCLACTCLFCVVWSHLELF